MSELTYEQLNVLTAPLNGNRVKTRGQGRQTLSYLEAWDVKATLIRVFGFANFSADVIDTKVLDIKRTPRTEEKNGKTVEFERIEVAAMVTVRLHIHLTGATYTETAAASQVGRDLGEVTDFAIKTAESDALKRCAIYLGTQFGLSLYDNGSLADAVRVVFDPSQRKAMTEGRAAQAAQTALTPPQPPQGVTDQARQMLAAQMGGQVIDSGPDSAGEGAPSVDQYAEGSAD